MKDQNREFQVFVKPVNALCNLGCHYCYYLDKENLYKDNHALRMSFEVLERYIVQHLEAATGEWINFSWHGGEPMLAGLEFFTKVRELQKKHMPRDRKVMNGIQTNGTLLNDEWCRFLKQEGFFVGVSLDGPERLHNKYRVSKSGKPSFETALHGYRLLKKYNIPSEILCVVHKGNVDYPLEVYRFFKSLGAGYLSFLPLVEHISGTTSEVSQATVPSLAFGRFMSAVFDEWVRKDIGNIKIQMVEEAARTAFNQDHTLCIFKETCGGVPVVEYNGDFYSCDHFVDAAHMLGNLDQFTLSQLIDSKDQREFGLAKKKSLPEFCLQCEVRDMCNGECPKNRFIQTPDGEEGLNYLCEGYRHFFNHCRPFVNTLARVWKNKQQKS